MRSVLLVKTSSLGDVVHNLPVASDIRARFPQARIDWVVEEGFADIPRLHPAWAGDPGGGAALAARSFSRHLARAARLRATRCAWNLRPGARHAGPDQERPARAPGARQARRLCCAEAAREPLAARFYDATYVIPKNLHAVERNRWLAAAALGYEPTCRSTTASPPRRWSRPGCRPCPTACCSPPAAAPTSCGRRRTGCSWPRH
jgi:heptosyltransferase-1